MNCSDCGSIFAQSGGSGRPRIRCFGCSPAQRNVGPRKKHREPIWTGAVAANCARCGAGFTRRLPHARYCSRRCGVAASNRAKQEKACDRSPRPCVQCGKTISPVYGDRRTTLCSDACRRAKNNKRRSGRTHARRARRFGCRVEKVDRIAIFQRDDWRCKFCGIETPRALLGSSANNAPQLDHEPPLSRGGEHTAEGTQLLCASCNLTKRDRTMDELRAALAA